MKKPGEKGPFGKGLLLLGPRGRPPGGGGRGRARPAPPAGGGRGGGGEE